MAQNPLSITSAIEPDHPLFLYPPLDSSKNEIRLLRLLQPSPIRPATAGDLPKCEMFTVCLDGIDNITFSAVSYVWGNPMCTKEIIVNSRHMLIAQNLYSFLVHAQRKLDLVLWIDALCINQEDLAEKTIQIQKLKAIFDRASNVLAWLGPCEDSGCQSSCHKNGHSGLRWLNAFGEEVRKSKSESGISSLTRRLEEELKSGTIPLDAVTEIWENTIWTRAWCVQELARLKVNVFMGPHLARTARLWTNLHLAYRFLYYDGRLKAMSDLFPSADGRVFFAADTFFPIFAGTNLKANDGSPTTALLEWLWMSRQYLQATDPRDRVFAILSLTKDVDDLGVIPDYSQSCERVYMDVARALYRKDATVLFHAIIGPKNIALPSFVPDWTSELPQRSIRGSHRRRFGENFLAGGPSIPQAIVNAAGTQLQVSGIVVDSVSFVADCEPEPEGVNNGVVAYEKHLAWALACAKRLAMVEVVYAEYFHKLGLRSIYGTAGEVEFALAHAVTAFSYQRDAGANSAADQSRRKEVDDILAGYRFWKTPTLDLISPEEADKFWASSKVTFLQSLAVVSGRRPFITSRGYIGLGPGNLEAGDLVCILLGFEVPVVLRRLDGDRFTIMNEAYVYGIMQGEFLKGDDVPSFRSFTLE
jgi:hypothetical protein